MVVSFASSFRISRCTAIAVAVSTVRDDEVGTPLTLTHAYRVIGSPIRYMPPLDTILFDMGGTLDGRGGWRERSLRLFVDVGLNRFSRDQHMAAFDYADAQSHRVGEMAHARLRDMLRCHIGWQLDVLQVDDADAARELVDRFASEAEQAAAV